MPSMLTSVAFSDVQLSCVGCPASTVVGVADNDAVGAAGGGGGGGAVATGFFLPQPAMIRIVVRAATLAVNKNLVFTSSSVTI